ncbi:MAG TPA: ABC transporter permease [Bryobacteraceae bacterium]|nr:ABC transporter permease [Bryobacteraceae bacterium]
MGSLGKDVRYSLRMLLHNPGFTVVAVLALALGIGANTAIFSVVNSILFRSLPFRDPSTLVMVWEKGTLNDRNVVSPANYLDWKSRNRVFGDLAAVIDIFQMNLTGAGEPEEVLAGAVSANFFQMIGVQPIIGRAFLPMEDKRGHDHVAILSHRLWRRRFGSDPATVGKSITLSGELHEVIGILPPDFAWNNRQTDVWVPYVFDPGRDYRATSGRYMSAVGRLKPGVTPQRAQAEMSGIARDLEREYPQFNKNWGVNLVPLHEQSVGDIRRALLVLMAAVGFVLLIACVNVANLLLAKAAGRHREIALRAALGAGRWRIVRQLLTESALLAAVGGLLGLALATWGAQALVALAPSNIPRLSEIGVDRTAYGFTFLVSMGTAILFGLAPALSISKANLIDALKEAGRSSTGGLRRHRARSLLVVAEVALALVLLIGAGLMIRSYQQLGAVKPGFNAERVLTMRLHLSGETYRQDTAVVSFFHEATERLGRLPGVSAAGAINFPPLTGLDSATTFQVPGRPDPGAGNYPVTGVRVVEPAYFRAMGIPLLRGRQFTERDTAQSPRVLIISQTLAQRFFADEDPIGKKLIIDWGDNKPDEIVGVVGDILHQGLDAKPEPIIYWPEARMPYNVMTMVVRTSSNPAKTAAAAVRAMHAIDPNLPVSDVREMASVMSESMARPRFNMLLLGIFAGLALALALVGIYGVIAYGVTERTQEIGIRLALGAGRGDVLRMVIRQGLLYAAAGIGTGALAALAMTRFMRDLLFGVAVADPATYAGVALVVGVTALLASCIPAWRAAKVDPMVALRYE